MNLYSASFFGALTVLGAIVLSTSCSRMQDYAGAWQGLPVRLEGVSGASDASSVVTIDFAPSDSKNGSGDVMLLATVDVSQAVESGSPFVADQAYQVDVAATASISGRYVPEDDAYDDVLLLSLDASTLKVNIDQAGVTFSQNVLTGLQQPALDSLTAQTVDAWRVRVTSAIREEFSKYQKMEDVKVHHADMMSCEIADRDYTFRRISIR